jgi:PAS domain S-box-containing protein
MVVSRPGTRFCAPWLLAAAVVFVTPLVAAADSDPSTSVVLVDPLESDGAPSFWEAYRWHVVGVISLCALEGLLILRLLVQRAKLRRSEAVLRESEARFRLMADAAPVLIWMSGPDRGCTYTSRSWLEFTGRPAERELGDGWAEGIHPDDVPRCLAIYTSHFDAREPFEMVFRHRRHDGEYRWILDRGVPRFTADGEFAGYVGACTDITEQRRAEDGLRANRRELQLLAGQLIEAQEAERRRIARELHDDLNQGLALLAVDIDLLGQRPPGSTAELRKRIHALSARVKELSSAVHDLSHQLHPSKLEHLGLVAGVRGLCQEMCRHHGVEVEFAHRDVPDEIPEATALCLYRIAQEALRNVVKHGRTDRATVELTGTPGGLRLQVRDPGVGFDPSAPGNGGLGLVSMRERLSLVGGQMVIDTRPAGGTRIDVRVPLAEPADEPAEDSTSHPCEAVLAQSPS